MIDDRADGQLPLVQQMCLPLANVIGAEPIRRLAEILCEPLDSAEIAAYSFRREVTTLELFQHQFAKSGHKGPPCDPLLYLALTKGHRRRASVRRPAALFLSATRQLDENSRGD